VFNVRAIQTKPRMTSKAFAKTIDVPVDTPDD
jgi:hypothetical protein